MAVDYCSSQRFVMKKHENVTKKIVPKFYQENSDHQILSMFKNNESK